MTSGFALDIVNANNREELVRVLAEYRVVPKKNPMADSEHGKTDYTFERRGKKVGSKSHAFGTQSQKSIINKLGIDSDVKCEKVREEIKSHPRWGKHG